MFNVYHGSNMRFNVPLLEKARDKRDFGKGFYTTTVKSQAEGWATIMYERCGGDGAYLYTFAVDNFNGLRVKQFPDITTEWLEMVKENRLEGGTQHDYDIVRGPVADDNTLRTVALYVAGIYDANYAMDKLRYFQANDQISFHTEAAIAKLILQRCEDIG
jgi:hypothetical protein